MNKEEKKAIKIINIRTKRLIEELNVELTDEEPDEPRVAYLTQQIEANKTLLNLIEKQQKELEELKHFKEEVIDIIKYADDTAEPTYWNIRKLLGMGEIDE